MTTFTNVSMTRNTLKKFADLQAHIESLTDDRRAVMHSASLIFNGVLADCGNEYHTARELAFQNAEYVSKVEKARTIAEDIKTTNAALTKFKARYLKAPVLGDVYKRTYKLSLQHPRDGMGRLKLASNNLDNIMIASGCGYDKIGTVVGKWIAETFDDVLQSFNDVQLKEFYGVNRYNGGKITLDGACGINCMTDLLNWLGYDVHTLNDYNSRYNETIGYIITPRNA